MKTFFGTIVLALLAFVCATGQTANSNSCKSQWEGKKVAFLGDSMTDKWDPENKMYWEYLTDWLGIKPFVYGINGNQWDGIHKQAQKLHAERGTDIDAIMIFAGTNDYNASLPLGNFFIETMEETNHNGHFAMRKHRKFVENSSTFCGRINIVMSYLKDNFPDQQIIIFTPIHRGYAKFSETNIQPEESFANALGLYIDDYVNTLKEAAGIWSVPAIDLFSLTGLYPMKMSQTKYIKKTKNDRLHINSLGNYRLAKTVQYQLLALPSTFVVEK